MMGKQLAAHGLSLVLGISLIAWCATAQSPAEGKESDFSGEPYIVEQISTNVTLESDGTAIREGTAQVRIQSEAGVQQFGLLIFPYQGAHESLQIDYVRVRKTDGSLIMTPTENILEMPAEITRVAPMYSDLRQKHVAVKGLGPGDLLEHRATWRVHSPLVPGHFWLHYTFFKDAIVLHEELRVSAPRHHPVKVKSPEVQPTISEQGSHRIYTWKTTNLERKSQGEKSKLPISELSPPSILLSTFQSWEDFGRWYGALVAPQVRPSAEIRAKAAELIKGAASDAEKLRALYHYVATKFRYISLSFGIGSYQPHAAAEVLVNQYGDCKDKHTLLASLLGTVGLKAYPVLIHSSLKIDPDVSSPAQFDHLITAVPLGNDFLWLDTTTEIAPVGFLSSNLRDKLALVIPDDRPPFLTKTPPDPPFAASQLFQIEGKLSQEGTLQARVQLRARGDLELILRAAFRHTPQPQWKDIVQALSYASGFGGTVSDVAASQPEATDAPFLLTYNYTRENFSDWGNHRITSALPDFGLPAINEGGKKSEEPILLGAPGEILYQAKLELPPRFMPQLPAAKDIKQDFADYRATYTFATGILQAERRLTVKLREVPPARRDDYRAFQRAIRDDESTYITEARRATTPAGSDNPEAQNLYNQGAEALERQKFLTARDFFQRAVALDPKFGGAWLALAMTRMSLHDADSAVEALEKLIESKPAADVAYKAKALMLMWLQRPEESVEAWKEVQRLAPQDRDAAANAASILFGLGRYAESAFELETAVKLNPASAQLHLFLARSHLRAGAQEKAMVALRKAVELDPSPANLNNVAYELVEHSHRFTEALEYAEKAVRLRENETTNIQLDKLGSADLERMAALGAEWDTLGWVHFRLGDLKKAEKYLHAAWTLLQDAEVGDHLGQLYEKQGKTSTAAKAYAWALAVPSGYPRQATRERLRHLLGSESRVEAMVNRAREELGKMRTFKLGQLTSHKATAEFFIVFSVGPKVEGVKFISGADELREATQAVASGKYDVRFPDDGPTKLVRRAMLFCSGRTSDCDLVLHTADRISLRDFSVRLGFVRF